MSKQERKQDTRDKIMMGGLIIKAKLSYLHQEHKDVLLGVLIDAYQKLQSDEADAHFQHYKMLGNEAFLVE